MAALSRLGPVPWPNDVDHSVDACPGDPSCDAGPWHGPTEESWLRRLLRGAALPTDTVDVPRAVLEALAALDAASGFDARWTPAAPDPAPGARGVLVALPGPVSVRSIGHEKPENAADPGRPGPG